MAHGCLRCVEGKREFDEKGKYASVKFIVHLDDRKDVNAESKTGLVGSVHRDSLNPPKKEALSVYAFVTSAWMRYPKGNHARSHTFKVDPATGDAIVVVDVCPTVPENCLLHLTLVSAEPDVRRTRIADVELARATVELKQACTEPVVVRLQEPRDIEWSVGNFVVRLHPDSKAGGWSAFSVPRFHGEIARTEPSKKLEIATRWASFNFENIWKRFESRVYFPDKGLFVAELKNEVVDAPEGRMPMLFYLYHASRFQAENPTEFADAIIRLGCVRAGITVKRMLSLTGSNPLLLSVLCYALSGLPLALGYCTDARGSAYGLPVAAESIARAPGMCVEFSTLITVASRAITQGTSVACRKMQSVLASYRVCTANCTSRAGGIEPRESDSISRHLTVLLIPKQAMSELALPVEKPAPVGSRTHTCLWVDPLEQIEPSPIAPTPGSLSEFEACVLDGVLPYTMRPAVAFDIAQPGSKAPGPKAFYRSVMKVYSVDGPVLEEYTCLRREGGQWVIGVELMDLVLGRVSASNTRFYCPLPTPVGSKELKAFEADFQETLCLTNLYQKLESSVYLSEAKADQLVEQVQSLPTNCGWRFGFYVMKEPEDVHQLQTLLDGYAARVPLLSKKYPRAKISRASAEILGIVNVTGNALSACVLLKYEAA